MRSFLSALIVLLASLPAAAQATLRVAAAADLSPVLPPILQQFEHKTGIRVEATYQASAALTTMLQNGAPFGLFLSADMSYPERLASLDLTSGAPVPYARGTLVLWTRKDGSLGAPSLDLLRDSKLKRLAIASPERAPYGRAAVAALKKLNLYEQLQPRLATAENIAQAAQFALTGNADAGLISLTSARTPALEAAGTAFILPPDLYPAVEQGAVLLKGSAERDQAQALLSYLLSPPVQKQLERAGLMPVR